MHAVCLREHSSDCICHLLTTQVSMLVLLILVEPAGKTECTDHTAVSDNGVWVPAVVFQQLKTVWRCNGAKSLRCFMANHGMLSVILQYLPAARNALLWHWAV